MRSKSVAKVEKIANCHSHGHEQRKAQGQEREPKTTSFVSTLVQIPDSIASEKVIREAHIPRTDFLIAITGIVHLPSHDHLHKRKRAEQDNCHGERNFVHWHNHQF